MKILKIFIIIFLSICFSHLKADEKNDELKSKILKNIRCLICQGQSVYDSESEFASSIKLIVDRKTNEGLREDQIYRFFYLIVGHKLSNLHTFLLKTYISDLLLILH